MKHLILLSHHLNTAYIEEVKPGKVTLVIVDEQFSYYNYHQFRIIYHLSAAKHFAKDEKIDFVHKDSWKDVFEVFNKSDQYIIYHPNDQWMYDDLKKTFDKLKLKIIFLPDINFFHQDIEKEFGDPPYKLESLYKKWRKDFNILMNDKEPIGKKYSFDSDNRQRPPNELDVPSALFFEPDDITQEIIEYVESAYVNHPKSAHTFNYPVTKSDATKAFQHFIKNRLPYFGKYQDAMMENEPFMAHSLVSASINLGLLQVKDVVEDVEKAYRNNDAPIEAVEGFIRQVLGWREYIRGIYSIEMKNDYHLSNAMDNQYKKPKFLYDGDVELHCLNKVIHETIEYGYNHHIQRLMIIGNITNMMGIHPKHIREWFNEMYIDSFDWVVTPNVLGMAMYADGGLMSTKPYISSANYINNMSEYCKNCKFNPKEKTGSKACPVTALYYCYLDRHKDRLRSNGRMRYMYINFDKLSKDVFEEMTKLVNQTLAKYNIIQDQSAN